LTKTDYQDFGREIFPASIRARRVQVHLFDGYWEDIGTIDSFYRCNLALAGRNPPFDFVSAEAPIYTRTRYLPPSRLDSAAISGSLVADGCIIGHGAVIENSVIGLRCQIGRDAVILNSVLMGADFYETPAEAASHRAAGRPPLGIGSGTRIDGAIVDKNCRIGSGVTIVNERDVVEADISPDVVIRDRIIVVEKEAVLPDGWRV
ncbi:MAG: glucose-1-phosphate adenylyltransferase, partial [Planctomycetia bacterium]|nr:glucose-1-phosphate adenylyltransferase [Planctomycetia bacterium]